MDGDKIRKWRPSKFADVIGQQNRNRINRFQQQLLKGQLPDPVLIVGIYGYAKTSLARLLLKSLDCRSRDPVTADPCGQCVDCRCFGKFYHGYGTPYRRYEYDCTTLGRPEVIAIINEHRFETDEALFMDEFHHLHEKFSQEPLLKFVEDFDGVLIAAIMEDRLPELIPPLKERFDVLQLVPPTAAEMVALFRHKSSEWNIVAPLDVIEDLVAKSGLSFRICLKVFGAAADRPDRTLTRELINEMLNLGDNRDDSEGEFGEQAT